MQRLSRPLTSVVGKLAFNNTLRVEFAVGKRFISESSWAADQLKAKGESLTPASSEVIAVNDDTINNPSKEVKELAEKVLQLNVVEANQLLRVIQKRIGVSDAMLEGFFSGGGGGGARAVSAEPAAEAKAEPAAPAKPKEAWDLKLVSFDAASKIKIIKEIRTITALGLKEAKEMAEKPLPVILKTGVKKEDADKFQKLMKEAGGVMELV